MTEDDRTNKGYIGPTLTREWWGTMALITSEIKETMSYSPKWFWHWVNKLIFLVVPAYAVWKVVGSATNRIFKMMKNNWSYRPIRYWLLV